LMADNKRLSDTAPIVNHDDNTTPESKENICQGKIPNQLSSYKEFRKRVKLLSHIKLKRPGGYFHHLVVLAISPVSDGVDAVTIGHYTTSAEIETESSHGIGKFIQQTIFIGENDTNDIFDFNQGVYLVEKENYPKTKDEIEEAFNRLSERIGERMYEISSNNCEHAINYILTGKSVSHQADTKTCSRICFIDLINILIIDCKEVGLKTALLVAALGAIAGALVRRAYVKIIVASIVSLTVESRIIKCGDTRGSNLRQEADFRIDLAAHVPDIKRVLSKSSIAILDNMKNHTDTTFVCKIAEKLIYEAALKASLATVTVAIGIESILFLSFVFYNLIPRRRKKTLDDKHLCRLLFMHLFSGYGSIGLAVVCGYFAFLDFNRPALSFFGINRNRKCVKETTTRPKSRKQPKTIDGSSTQNSAELNIFFGDLNPPLYL
ncbi:hypothetical protein AM593_10183, partial [Mytilus galloprovincialis]